MTAMIEARGLVHEFHTKQGRTRSVVRAVDGVDLDVAEGEVVGFLGPNGAGKTTTLRMLTTLLTPDAGTARVAGYDARWLDELCLSGEVVWGRLTPRPERTGRPGTPSPSTPLAFVVREDLDWMLRAVRAGAEAPDPEVGAAADVLAALRTRGACFRPELAPLTGRLPAEVDEGLWDLVARGIVTADAFSAVRSLLSARDRWRTRTYRRPTGRSGGGRPGLARRAVAQGRAAAHPAPLGPAAVRARTVRHRPVRRQTAAGTHGRREHGAAAARIPGLRSSRCARPTWRRSSLATAR